LSFLSRIFGSPRSERERLRPLYDAIVARGRDPAWYLEGGVPDTLDGRFDILTAVMTMVLLRLEAEGDRAKRESVLLTETFIDDMDGTIRQIGIGDLVVGKHVGRMMGALGGRLQVFRDAADLEPAVRRNIFHEAPPSDAAASFVAARLKDFRERLALMPSERILAGELP
jgi:cytochrome b pre-mRNA-processing protein 3